jgi:hypothetical protein
MESSDSGLVIVTGDNSNLVPWSKISGAQLVKKRVRFGFGSAHQDAKTEQIIIAK